MAMMMAMLMVFVRVSRVEQGRSTRRMRVGMKASPPFCCWQEEGFFLPVQITGG